MSDDIQESAALQGTSGRSPIWKLIAVSLILLLVNFFFSIKELRSPGTFLGKSDSVWTQSNRWSWEPFKVEYDLYQKHHYNLEWLDGPNAENLRKLGGRFSPFFELLALRFVGLFHYVHYLIIVIVFAGSMGSVRYHDTMMVFGNISSTINNIAIKTFLIGILLVILWCSLPFGMNFPVVGGIPTELNVPIIGKFWLSNPAFGAFIFGAFYSAAAYLMGANFSRNI